MSKEKRWWRDFGVGQKVIKLLENNIGSEFILFDTETTGLNPTSTVDKNGNPIDAAVIIQLSAMKFKIDEDYQFHKISEMDMFINPGKPLPKDIVKFNEKNGTGINDELLAKYPLEISQWPLIYDFFGENPIVSGHNVPFDIGMMKALYQRNGHVFDPLEDMDTLKMAQELHRKDEAGSHKLGDLAEYFGLNDGLGFHNAMDDIIATSRLLRLFIDEYLEKKTAEEETPPPEKIQTSVRNCWVWNGYRGMQRLYVKVAHENRVLWVNQRRPYEWGEKDVGSIDLFDMADIESQVLKLYKVDTLEELSKVKESKYASFYKK